MKKAKIMLSTIAVVAVVGAAFAFKAHKEMNDKVTYFTCTSTDPSVGKCAQVIVAGTNTNTVSGLHQRAAATLATIAGANCNAQLCTNTIFYDATVNP